MIALVGWWSGWPLTDQQSSIAMIEGQRPGGFPELLPWGRQARTTLGARTRSG